MKWFKHNSNLSIDDKVERLEARMGLQGYAMLIKTMELCAEQLDSKKPKTIFYFSMTNLQNKLRTKRKRIDFFFRTTSELEFWKAECFGNEVKINYPKLLEIRDNHTSNLQVTNKRSDQVDKDKDKDKDNKIKKPKFNFDKLYQKYPRKEGKQKGFAICLGKIKNQKDYDRLSQAIDNYAAQVKNEDKKFIKHFSSFMNCWEDYVLVEKPKQTKELWVGGKDGPVYK